MQILLVEDEQKVSDFILKGLQAEKISADLAAAWENPASGANVALAPRDQVMVFDMEAGREHMLAPLVAELSRQGDRDAPPQTVGVGGRVRMRGQYPLEPGMTVSDLVRAGGSLDESAFGGQAELTRYQVVDGQSRQTVLIEIDLARALAGDTRRRALTPSGGRGKVSPVSR